MPVEIALYIQRYLRNVNYEENEQTLVFEIESFKNEKSKDWLSSDENIEYLEEMLPYWASREEPILLTVIKVGRLYLSKINEDNTITISYNKEDAVGFENLIFADFIAEGLGGNLEAVENF